MLTKLVIVTALAVIIIVILAAYLTIRRERLEEEALEDARSSGMNQPVSLHPVIDLEVCIGSGACVDVCPESVLGRPGGITQLISAAGCIGHGRCHDACPVDAITLVFGTAERGVDIPLLRKNYQSNVDGIYIVGELGGMGLIRNAMRQGTKAVELGVSKLLADPEVTHSSDPDVVDVVIVGGGPAGIAAALECANRDLTYVVLEQFSLGGSVAHYPRRKLVFTEQIKLPIVGKFGKAEMLKEELIAEFERVCLAGGITLQEGRRVTGVSGNRGDFTVSANIDGEDELYRGRSVVLAIGRRGTPRQLGCPGEEQSHVVYRLIDPEQYRERRVLCVGGGDSSVEAAISLGGTAGTEVHLSYRGESFYRVKKKNRAELEAAVARGEVRLHLETSVQRIGADEVVLGRKDGTSLTLGIDDVIVNIGGVLPTPFLESMGIEVETKYGEGIEEDGARPRSGRKSRTKRTKRVSGALARTRARSRSTRLPPSTRLRRRRSSKSLPRDLELESGPLESGPLESGPLAAPAPGAEQAPLETAPFESMGPGFESLETGDSDPFDADSEDLR